MGRWLWTHHLIALTPILLIGAAGGLVAWVCRLTSGRGGPDPQGPQAAAPGRILLFLVLAALLVPNLALSLRRAWNYTSPGKWADEREVLPVIRSNATPADLCITDEQMLLFRTGRDDRSLPRRHVDKTHSDREHE